MAAVVSIARGHDASYPFKAIGAADGATIQEPWPDEWSPVLQRL